MSLPRVTQILENTLNTAKTKIKVECDLNAGDIEIGAVEIKNSTDDTRATVGANGLYVDVRNIAAGTNLIGAVKVHGQKDSDGTIAEALSYTADLNTRPVMRIVDAAPYNAPAVGATIYHVALTTLNTEYSQVLPLNCKFVSVNIIGGVSTDTFRVAYATGKVATPIAPYMTLCQNMQYVTPNININMSNSTIYIASSASSRTAVIEAWA